MRLSLRLLGLDLIDLTVTTDDETPSDETPSDDDTEPRTFGFHGSGSGIIERAEPEQIDFDTYEDRSR